jgi:hypothetical protein
VVVNNASFETADRGTHLKIVVVSLIAAVVIMVGGLVLRSAMPPEAMQASATVVKAGKPVAYSRNDMVVVR